MLISPRYVEIAVFPFDQLETLPNIPWLNIPDFPKFHVFLLKLYLNSATGMGIVCKYQGWWGAQWSWRIRPLCLWKPSQYRSHAPGCGEAEWEEWFCDLIHSLKEMVLKLGKINTLRDWVILRARWGICVFFCPFGWRGLGFSQESENCKAQRAVLSC